MMSQKKLRIAVWHNLPNGGGKRALYDQIKGLTSRGHYVEAWCPPTASQTFLPLSSLIKENIVPLKSRSKSPKNWIGRRQYKAFESEEKMQLMEKHCQHCAREISTGKFDLLLIHPCLFFRTSPIAIYSRLPSILYLQEPYRELYEAWPKLPWIAEQPDDYRPYSLGYWNKILWEMLKLHSKRVQIREELTWAKSCDQILVNSLFSRESLLRAYNVDSRVCYLGIDTQKFRPNGAAKELLVIGLGNIFFNKRPLLAVQAVGAIPEEKRPKLVWVGNSGDPDYLKQIKKEAESLRVNFISKESIGDDELIDLLSRAAAMIYTSHLEPFGFAPLEANACGTGVVAIAEGGIRETVGNSASGIMVPNSSPRELADALLKFTSDLKFSMEFGQKSHIYVLENWTLERAINRLEAEIERILTMNSNAVGK